MSKNLNKGMLDGALFPNIMQFTIPVMLTSILQLLFNAADLVVVGRFCGSVSVAAVGSTGAISNLLLNFFIGLSVGTGVAVAQGIGANDDEQIHRTIHTAIPTALISGLLLTVIGVVFCEPLLKLMGTPDTVLPLSSVYMRIYFFGITFTLLYNFCASILRASGDTKSPLIYLTIAGVINVILNVIFVTVFHLNVAGVALATTISQAISAILVFIALIRREDSCKLVVSKAHIYKEQFLKIVRIGLPAGIQGALFSISNVIIQSSVNSFGDVFMSGNAAANNIDSFIYVIMNSFHQTVLNFVGQNIGAENYKRVKSIYLLCLLLVTIFGGLAGSLAYLFSKQLLSIYITDSPQAIIYGAIKLAYVGIPYFICGLVEVTTGALRGMGSSVPPMIISVVGICGMRIFWIYAIFSQAQFHTPECLFLSYPISWTITFIAQLISFFLVYKKKIQSA